MAFSIDSAAYRYTAIQQSINDNYGAGFLRAPVTGDLHFKSAAGPHFYVDHFPTTGTTGTTADRQIRICLVTALDAEYVAAISIEARWLRHIQPRRKAARALLDAITDTVLDGFTGQLIANATRLEVGYSRNNGISPSTSRRDCTNELRYWFAGVNLDRTWDDRSTMFAELSASISDIKIGRLCGHRMCNADLIRHQISSASTCTGNRSHSKTA